MENKFLKLILICISIFLMVGKDIEKINASSYSISSNKQTVYVGETFNISFTANDMYAYFSANTNGPVTTVTGFPNDIDSMGQATTKTAVYKATSVGTITVNITGTGSYYSYEGNEAPEVNINKTITINVVEKSSTGSSGGSSSGSSSSGTTTPSKPSANYSKDNNLKSLTISEGTLSPAFSASTTSYTVELGATVKSLKVDAVANDKKASVKGTGTKELEPGENTIKITVTAENGNPKVYTITAIVDEKPLVFLPYNGGELGVVRNLKDVPKLDGFEETKLVIDGNETRAWHSSTRNITLIYLQNGDSKDFYIYDEAKGVISIYKPLGILGNNLGIIDIPEELKNKAAMQFGEVEVDGLTLNGWTYDNEMFKNYSLIYAMDESGNYNYYQYEKTQNTLQLYSGAAPILQEDYDAIVKENEKMTMYFYMACGVAVVSVVLAIVGFVNANKYKNRLLSRNEVKVD